MTAENPFKIRLSNKAFAFKGWIGDPTELSVTVRHNGLSTASLSVPTNHRRIGELITDGARLEITYDGVFLMSGIVDSVNASGPDMAGNVTVTVLDDLRLLRSIGMPNPGLPQAAGSMPSQGADTAYYKASGTAEAIVKDVVKKNLATFFEIPITCATNLNRGTSPSGGVQFRFHPLLDKLLPMADANGIGITVKQSGAGYLCDVYTPNTYALNLTEASGVITDWSWKKSIPTATRVVSGGQGEGTARAFRYKIDAARESDYNETIAVFRDARDAETNAILDARAMETLKDGAPTVGLSLTLAETKTFKYGKTFKVGDIVTATVGGLPITDVLRSVELNYTIESGVDVTPGVGELMDEPNTVLAAAIKKLASKQRDLGAR